jgi:sulfur transfer complex TusBCD TusB component (DsrH family)
MTHVFPHTPFSPTAAKDVSMTFRNGLASLLRPEDSVLVLIDHPPYQLALGRYATLTRSDQTGES